MRECQEFCIRTLVDLKPRGAFNLQVYEHRIYRYLENPSEPLANIKDDEHIVAYRLPKKDADLTRLEICHRYQDM